MPDKTVDRRDYTAIEVLEMLRPYDPVGIAKVRVGERRDGGYVMLDQLRAGQTVISYGVGRSVSFEVDLAARGLCPHLFDHTVSALPIDNERIAFHHEGVGPERDKEKLLDTVAAHVAAFGAPGANNMILKMDVECAEWQAILATPDDVLCRFEQIVMELHDLGGIAYRGNRPFRVRFFEKLNQNFRLCHVHSNCAKDFMTVDGLPVPNFLEVSYARRDLCEFAPSRTVFPTELDAPCHAGKPEHRLWFFPFLPATNAP